LFKKKRSQIIDWIHSTSKTFKSLGRVKFVIAAAALVFLGLFGLMVGLIQDFMGQELTQFDTVSSYIIQTLFNEDWSPWMDRFEWISSLKVLYPLATVTLIWILFKGKERVLESAFLLFVIFGGELLDEGLRRVFHRLGPIPSNLKLPYTFPSEQTLITLTIYGFTAYLLFRHYGNVWTRVTAPVIVIVIVLVVGISRIYFNVQYPSDVLAGYVFGGVWLTLNIVLLELFRMLQKEKRIL
jgi:membrane-associated phospholipid phosphatase